MISSRVFPSPARQAVGCSTCQSGASPAQQTWAAQSSHAFRPIVSLASPSISPNPSNGASRGRLKPRFCRFIPPPHSDRIVAATYVGTDNQIVTGPGIDSGVYIAPPSPQPLTVTITATASGGRFSGEVDVGPTGPASFSGKLKGGSFSTQLSEPDSAGIFGFRGSLSGQVGSDGTLIYGSLDYSYSPPPDFDPNSFMVWAGSFQVQRVPSSGLDFSPLTLLIAARGMVFPRSAVGSMEQV